MNDFNFEHVNFQPWVGENYKNNDLGFKLLVLGESHYCEHIDTCKQCRREIMKEDCFKFTKRVIKDNYLKVNGGCPRQLQSFLCFERAVYGYVIDRETRLKFWNSVVFYNYFQNAQPKARHNLEQNASLAAEAFREVLVKFKPDYIVVWGVRLFNNLPCWNGTETSIVTDTGASTRERIYNINGKEIPAMMVYHPSTPKGKKENIGTTSIRNFYLL